MRRQHRLTHRRQFAELRRRRIAATCGCLRAHAGANGLPVLRAGFAITGVSRAVDRNAVRRRLRALLHPRRGELAGLDLLVAAGPASATAGFAELAADLAACLAAVVPRARAAGAPPHPAGFRRSPDRSPTRVRDNGGRSVRTEHPAGVPPAPPA